MFFFFQTINIFNFTYYNLSSFHHQKTAKVTFQQNKLSWKCMLHICASITNMWNVNRIKLIWFQACADVEIDEYQNYEKAHGALTECLKFYERSEKTELISSRLIQVSRQLELVACFVECQRSYTSNPTKSMQVRK